MSLNNITGTATCDVCGRIVILERGEKHTDSMGNIDVDKWRFDQTDWVEYADGTWQCPDHLRRFA